MKVLGLVLSIGSAAVLANLIWRVDAGRLVGYESPLIIAFALGILLFLRTKVYGVRPVHVVAIATAFIILAGYYVLVALRLGASFDHPLYPFDSWL